MILQLVHNLLDCAFYKTVAFTCKGTSHSWHASSNLLQVQLSYMLKHKDGMFTWKWDHSWDLYWGQHWRDGLLNGREQMLQCHDWWHCRGHVDFHQGWSGCDEL